MSNNRNTYKYHFKQGNRIVHTGITNDLDRREQEHQQTSGWSKGHIKQVGHAVTRASAQKWEQQQRDQGKPTEKK